MRIIDWFGIVVLVVMLGALVGAAKAEDHTIMIMVPVTDRWVAEQGFIVTSPDGERFACEIGIWTPEFETDEVSLACAPFGDTKRYRGHKDGELELVL